MLDVALPVHGAPLQMIVTEPTAPLLMQLIAHADKHLTLKQVANSNVVIGGGWSADVNPRSGFMRVNRRSLEGNLWVAQRVVPALAKLHILRSWAAMNINIDGAPVIAEVVMTSPNSVSLPEPNCYHFQPVGSVAHALSFAMAMIYKPSHRSQRPLH